MSLASIKQTNLTSGEVNPVFHGRNDIANYQNGAKTLLNFFTTQEGSWFKRPPTKFIRRSVSNDYTSRLIKFIRSMPDQVYVLEFSQYNARIHKDRSILKDASSEPCRVGYLRTPTAKIVTSITRAATTATVTTTNAHGYSTGQYVTIAGANQTEYNISAAITVTGGTTFTYTVAGAPATPATLAVSGVGITVSNIVNPLITNITTAGSTATVTTSTPHGYTTGDIIVVYGSDTSSYNGSHKVMSAATTTTFTFTVTGSPGVANTGYVLTTVLPYTAAQAKYISKAQSVDVMFLDHNDVEPMKLQHYGDKYWVLQRYDAKDGPYLDQNTSTVTMTPSAVSGANISITASSATFALTDVGRMIRIRHANTSVNPNIYIWGAARIVEYISTTVVRAEVQSGHEFYSANANKNWRLGAWSDYRGWPGVVALHEQRLFHASTDSQPDTFWSSCTDDFDNFGPSLPAIGDPTSISITQTYDTAASNLSKSVSKNVDGDSGDYVQTDDSAITFTLASEELNEIQWLLSERGLVLGTQSGEWGIGTGDGASGGLTPVNVVAKQYGTKGSTRAVPIRASDNLLFVGRTGKRLYEALDDITTKKTDEASLLSRHLIESEIVDLTYAENPYGIVWMVNGNGELIGCTYNPDQKVKSWHRHVLGGTGAFIEAIVAVPYSEGVDDVYLQVRRTVNGSQVRQIEYLSEFIDVDPDADFPVADLQYLDGSIDYDFPSVPATTFTGMNNFDGDTVSVVVNGYQVEDVTVSAGAATLLTATDNAHFGYAYDAEYESLPLSVAGNQFSTGMNRKRVVHINPRFYKTNYCKYGHSDDHMREFLFRYPDDDMDTATQLYTGEKRTKFTIGHRRNQTIRLVSDAPLPCNILSLEYSLDTGNR